MNHFKPGVDHLIASLSPTKHGQRFTWYITTLTPRALVWYIQLCFATNAWLCECWALPTFTFNQHTVCVHLQYMPRVSMVKKARRNQLNARRAFRAHSVFIRYSASHGRVCI